MSSCKMFSVQLTHSEDAAERGVSDPAVLGEGNVALDLIIHLVAADNEDAAAFEQLIGHFLPVLDLGRSVALPVHSKRDSGICRRWHKGDR